jgi:hypothetical protein
MVAGILLLLVGSVTYAFIDHALTAHKRGQYARVQLLSSNDETAYLQEALALRVGAMALANADMGEWHPLGDGRTKAPDGTVDRYLVRNTVDPRKGKILYENTTTGRWLLAKFEMSGDRVSCRLVAPK